MMKMVPIQWRWILAILPVAALLYALLPVPAVAATTMGGNDVNIKAGQVIHDDLYIAGSNVNMNGTVTGNLIAGAGNVNVNGRVGGSILAAGGDIAVNGVVYGSVIVAGGNLDVTGRVDGDVTMVGGTVTMASSSVVGRDVFSGAATTIVRGRIARDVKTSGGKVDLRSGAVIGRDLTYRGNTRPTIPAGVTIQGQVRHEAGGVFIGWWNTEMPWNQGPWVLGWLRTLVGLLALGLLFVWLAPKYSRRTVANLETRWLASLGWGLIALIATPNLAALVFIIGLWIGGWWLGLMALFIYVVALVLAVTVAGLTAVAWSAARVGRPWPIWAAMLGGVVLVSLVGLVPYLGWVVLAIGLVWALGGLVMTLFQRPPAPMMLPPEVPLAAGDGAAPIPPVVTPVRS